MTGHSKFVEPAELRLKVVSAVDILCNASKPGLKLLRLLDGSILPTGDIRHLLARVRAEDSIQSITYDIITKTCERAEAVGPGSSRLTLEVAKACISTLELDGIVRLRNVILPLLDAAGVAVNAALLEDVLSATLKDDRAVAMLSEALALAGADARIFIEHALTMQSSVIRRDGYNIPCEPDASFYSGGKWEADNVKCLIVDGIIDRVSEIDTLLQACHEKDCPMAIFARGFNPEVLTTLRLNRARRTLNVIAAIVPFDLDTANVLNDIAVITGQDVISSLKGDVVSTTKFNDIRSVKRLTFSNQTAAFHGCSGKGVIQHIKMLRQMRRDEDRDVVKGIIDGRLRSLTSSSVIISVHAATGPAQIELMGLLDLGLKTARVALQRGVVTKASCQVACAAVCDVTGFDPTPARTLPWVTFASSLRLGLSAAETLVSLGGALVDD